MAIFKGAGLYLCIFLLSTSGCVQTQPEWENLYTFESDEVEEVSGEISEGSFEQKEQKTDELLSVHVYVCGAVVNPGVYELPLGARINHAIEAAGGLTEDADLLLVNQAQVLEDGEQVRIYTKEEAKEIETTGEAVTQDNKVNINKADKELLMTLPGIGESKALAIIEYRQTKGFFQTIDDVMNIPGIKEAIFSKIKNKITV